MLVTRFALSLILHCRPPLLFVTIFDMHNWKRYDIKEGAGKLHCGSTTFVAPNWSKRYIVHISPLGASTSGAPGECWEMPHDVESHPKSLLLLFKQELPSSPVLSISQSAVSCK